MNEFNCAIVVAYVLICIFIGRYSSNRINTIREYTLGFKDVSIVVLVASTLATAFGAGSFIGAITRTYNQGLLYGIPLLLTFLSWNMMGAVIASNFESFRHCLSVSEVIKTIYGKSAGVIASLLVIVCSVGMVSIQISAIGLVLHHSFSLRYEIGVFLSAIVIVVYSIKGGFWSVSLIDFFQAILFFAVIPIVCGLMLQDVSHDKLGNAASVAHNFFINLNSKDTLYFLGLCVFWIFPSFGAPYVQRALAAGESARVRTLFNTTSVFALLYCLSVVSIGLLIASIGYGTSVTEANVYKIISDFFPKPLLGFFISAVLAISMSTASSWLNVSSAAVAHDLVKITIPGIRGKTELSIARISVVGIALFASIFSLYDDSLISKLLLIKNVWQPFIVVPLFVGFLKIKVPRWCFLYGMLTAMIFVLIGWVVTSELSVISISLGMAGNALCFIVGIISTKLPRRFAGDNHLVSSSVRAVSKLILNLYRSKIKSQSRQFFFVIVISFLIIAIPNLILQVGQQVILFDFAIYFRISCIFLLLLFVLCFRSYLDKNIDVAFCAMLILGFAFLPSYDAWSYKPLYLYSFTLLLSFCYVCCFIGLVGSVAVFLVGMLGAFGVFFLIRSLSPAYYAVEGSFLSWAYACAAYSALIVLALVNKYLEKEEEVKLARVLGGMVAHDLRSPLMLIRSYLYAVKGEEGWNNNKVPLALRSIEQAVDSSSKMIDEFLLLAYSRASIHVEECPLIDVVLGALSGQSVHCRDIVQVKISNNFSAPINKVLMVQVLANLLRNAIESLSEKRLPQIQIRLFMHNGQKFISIKDNGPGISPLNLRKIFRPFFSTKDSSGGIGLTFCKYALDQMNIKIECHSIHGRYAEFLLIFRE